MSANTQNHAGERLSFCGEQPCRNCPYRVDTKRQLWALYEFKKLINHDRNLIGAVYRCHKKDGSVCRGWLLNQRERNFPSVILRMTLANHQVPEEYLNALDSPAPLFPSIEAMIEANYPLFSIPVRAPIRMDMIEAQVECQIIQGQIIVPPMPEHPDQVKIGVLGPGNSPLRGKIIWIDSAAIVKNYGFMDAEDFSPRETEFRPDE